MNQYKIEQIKIDDLHFDFLNPRLAEFNLSKKVKEEEILKLLWDTMSVDEIVLSIAASGFFNHEPLIVLNEGTIKTPHFIVIEGNRRLAAVKSILHPNLLKDVSVNKTKISVSGEIKKDLVELPVIKVGTREEAWKYIGFKHINGPAKWGSYAKAQYISQIHLDYKIPLNAIAIQIGDTHRTVQKLYQGLKVIEQAEKEKVFSRDDIYGPRLYFSHLYTGLSYDGIKEYLSLKEVDEEIIDPVPKAKKEELRNLMIWMFGSKKLSTEPVIRSQNPDLRRLDAVVKNRSACAALRQGSPLIVAYEMSQPSDELFENSLITAFQNLQKAQSYVSFGYQGDLENLNVATNINFTANDLLHTMENKHNQMPKSNKAKTD